MIDIDSLSQEQTVAVEKDLFNIVPQDYLISIGNLLYSLGARD